MTRCQFYCGTSRASARTVGIGRAVYQCGQIRTFQEFENCDSSTYITTTQHLLPPNGTCNTYSPCKCHCDPSTQRCDLTLQRLRSTFSSALVGCKVTSPLDT